MINLDYRDAKPIYLQIKDGIKKLIITGAIEQDEKLPSVREMAAMLAINPNTIQKAYRELETEGYLYSVSGKGTFASLDTAAEDIRRKELLEQLSETVEELMYLKMSEKDLKDYIGQVIKGRNTQ